MTAITEPGGPEIVLPQILDFAQAQVLRDTLIGLPGTAALVLDASAVERMSTPCAQVLLAAGRTAESTGTSLKILNASEVFTSALAELGLQPEFSKWVI